MHCTNCGRQMPEGAEFCTGCGHRPAEQAAAQPTVPAPADVTAPSAPLAGARGGPALWIVGCAFLVLAAVVVGVAIYFGLRSAPTPPTPPEGIPASSDVSETPVRPDIEVPRPANEGGINVPGSHSGGTRRAEPDPDDEDATHAVVEEFFEAWSEDDAARMRSLSVSSLRAILTDEAIRGYLVVSRSVEFIGKRGRDEYEFSVVETITVRDTIAEETTEYAIVVTDEDGEWLVSDLQKLRVEMAGSEGREEAEETLYALFAAWEAGDLEAWTATLAAGPAAVTTREHVGTGYEQTGFDVVYTKHPDEDTWIFQVREEYTNSDGGEGEEAYEVWIILEGGEWLVDNIFTFSDEEESEE